MKVMYVACNPDGSPELRVDREITELQQRFLAAHGEPVKFVAFPRIHVEELPLEISRHSPDILHISAHADDKNLALANASGARVELSGAMLRAFVDVEIPPRLIYLNACNSRTIAKALTSVVPMAIGTTAPITNRTAKSAALLFYDRLLSGATAQNAYEGSRAVIEALQSRGASSILYTRPGFRADREWLHQVPRIVVRFAEGDTKPDRHGFFFVETGVFGCPGNTSQLVLFTDDKTFIEEDDDEIDEDGEEYFLAGQLCRVIRSSPVRNIIWSEESEAVYGDYRMFAVGVTGSGDVFTAASTLCVAIEAYYRSSVASQESTPKEDLISAAVSRLRTYDGALAPSGGPLARSRNGSVASPSPKPPSKKGARPKSRLYRRARKK